MPMPRPRHATVIAYLALFAAMSGTAVAATTALKDGDTIIAKNTLSGNRLRTDTVTGSQVKESTLGTVPSASRAAIANALPPLAWHSFTLTNGWSDYPNSRPAAWALDAQGIVHLRGAIYRATGSATIFAAVPAAIRPPGDLWLTADTVNATTGRLEILPQVGFDVQDSANGANAADFTSLDGITYSAK
jgi:hypothetical protein